MTRINVVPPEELCNQHLLAEYREMPRMVSFFLTTRNYTLPDNYVLGKGHMKFFLNKFKYLHKRHKAITKELLRRGYKLSRTDSDTFKEVPSYAYNDWKPDARALKINRQRIAERMPKNPRY